MALNLPSAKLNKLYFQFHLEGKDRKSIDTNGRNISRGSKDQFK